MISMLYPDSQTAHLFVRSRHDAYQREAELERLARPFVEARRQQRRQRLKRLRLELARVVRRFDHRGIREGSA